ncbi:hypothetical protein OG474_43915 [Kribbella sp. NBC_01505]|uniref:hypothetical protein n=1 Tax=Kribbella sp. NBC_01505 TaxID=2903580 RepID=UPI0038700B54
MSQPDPFAHAQNAMTTFGVRAPAATSVVSFSLGMEGSGQLAPTFGPEVTTLTDERVATLKQYSGGEPRVISHQRHRLAFMISVKSTLTLAAGTAAAVGATGRAVGRGPKTAFRVIHALLGGSAEVGEVVGSEKERVEKAWEQSFDRFSIPFLIECEVIGVKYVRGRAAKTEWDLRARVVPYHGEGTKFRNFFCEPAVLGLKGNAYGGAAPSCEFEWSFYANGKRLHAMATEHQGIITLKANGQAAPVVSGTGGIIEEIPVADGVEELPVGVAPDADLVGPNATDAIRRAQFNGAVDPGTGTWKPDRDRVLESFRKYAADQYAVSLADGEAQNRVEEVFAAQNPSRWLLFLSHQSGQLYMSKTLRHQLKETKVYRSDEQAAALATTLKKLLDTAFETPIPRRTGAAAADDAASVARRYHREIESLWRQYDRQTPSHREELKGRICEMAGTGLVEVIRAHRRLTGIVQARDEAENAPGDGRPAKFAEYCRHIDGIPDFRGQPPYNKSWQ